ncbi:MAG: hypothetical protein LBJ31_07530 [Treponema sp.]|nr:hypothetical protein [Treponema sp.]
MGNAAGQQERKKSLIHCIVIAILVLYPVVIFCSLVVFKINLRYISFVVVIFAALYIFLSHLHYRGKNRWIIYCAPLLLLGIGITAFLVNSSCVLKLYPAMADVVYIVIFEISLVIPPPIVYNIALLIDKDMEKTVSGDQLLSLSRTMTIIWIAYFICDCAAAVITTFASSTLVWGIYNGGITYAIMGLIVLSQVLYYKFVIKKGKRA